MAAFSRLDDNPNNSSERALMPFIDYLNKKFSSTKTTAIVEQANKIINDWMAQGYKLTLRQIYYRFIALDWFPPSWIDDAYNIAHGLPKGTKNTLRNYKRLGDILNDARLNGLIDWDAMEDRTRTLRGLQHFSNPAEFIESVQHSYRQDKWSDQATRVEVWIEKDALLGIFEKVCNERDIDVDYFSCRGYNSQSEMWSASQRILYYEAKGQQTLILQFSDHDPSGIDMYSDIEKRLKMFRCNAVVKRLALTIKQVKKGKLPPNPAKESDIRFAKYSEKYGNESWELDALEPTALAKLVRDAVVAARDAKKWARAMKLETQQREEIKHRFTVRTGFFFRGRFFKFNA